MTVTPSFEASVPARSRGRTCNLGYCAYYGTIPNSAGMRTLARIQIGPDQRTLDQRLRSFGPVSDGIPQLYRCARKSLREV